jgi:hypothetical protein
MQQSLRRVLTQHPGHHGRIDAIPAHQQQALLGEHRAQGLGHVPEQPGREVQHVDAMVLEDAAQLVRAEQHRVRDDQQLRPLQQRGPDLEGAQIEGRVAQPGEAVLALQADRLVKDQPVHRSMSDQHL